MRMMAPQIFWQMTVAETTRYYVTRMLQGDLERSTMRKTLNMKLKSLEDEKVQTTKYGITMSYSFREEARTVQIMGFIRVLV